MNRILGRFIGIAVFAAVLCGGFVLSGANATECTVKATLSAPGAGDFEFVFEGIDDEGPFMFTITDGGSAGGSVAQGETTIITEEPQNGYAFGGIECEAGPGVVITEIPDGFATECVNASEGEAFCVITNVLILRSIPTLSEWGMIAAAAGLGLIGVFFAVRRRRAEA